MCVHVKCCWFPPRTVQYAVARRNNPAQDRPVSPYCGEYRTVIHPTQPSTAPLINQVQCRWYERAIVHWHNRNVNQGGKKRQDAGENYLLASNFVTGTLQKRWRYSNTDMIWGGHVACLGDIIIIIFTAIGLLPGGSGYFTCTQNMKLVTNKFKSGGLHEKQVVATWNIGNHLSICF